MKVKDFLKQISPYIDSDKDFCFRILKEDKSLYGLEVLYDYPFFNRIIKKDSEIDFQSSRGLEARKMFDMEVVELDCGTGRCGFVDSIENIGIVVSCEKEKDIEDVVSSFLDGHKSNPYFSDYVDVLSSYQSCCLEKDLEEKE